MDAAIGQKLEAPSPSHLPRRVAGCNPFRLAGKVRYSGAPRLRRGCPVAAGIALENDSENPCGSPRTACNPAPQLQPGYLSRRSSLSGVYEMISPPCKAPKG